MNATHDPVQELKRVVATAAYAHGHATARRYAPSRLRWLGIGFVLGVLATLWWAGAAIAQVPAVAETYRRDLVRIGQDVWGLDAPIALLAAQIQQESGWRPDAVSRVGAAGLTQFMPATARDVAARYGGGPPNPFDPRWAMTAQSRYMRELWKGADAINESERFAMALSAYSGGGGWLRRDIRLCEAAGRIADARGQSPSRDGAQNSTSLGAVLLAVEVVNRALAPVLAGVLPVRHDFEVGGPMNVAELPGDLDGRVAVQQQHATPGPRTDRQQQLQLVAAEVVDGAPRPCNPRRWFAHVEKYSQRADWAFKENREYPRRILLVLMPRYHAAGWGGPALHARFTGG